jgi:hypothetical protein
MPSKPVTRSVARKLAHDTDTRSKTSSHNEFEKSVKSQLRSREYNMTVKELKSQLKQAQHMISQLQEENRKMKKGTSENLDACEKALEKKKKLLRRIFPLHIQVKNMYKHNRVLQAESGSLKESLH